MAGSLPAGAAVSETATEPIKLLAPLAMTGPLATTGAELLSGAKTCLAQVNRTGGVRGRQINLIVADNPTIDGAADSVSRAMKSNPDAVAMLLPMQVVAVLEQIAGNRIPVIGAPGGAFEEHDLDRAPSFYHIKVGWNGEYEKIARQLASLGVERVAFIYDKVLGSGQSTSMARITQTFMINRLDIKPLLMADDAGGAEAVFAKLKEVKPQVIVLGLLGDSMLRFLDSYRAHSGSWPLYSSSLGNMASVRQAVGRAGTTIGVAQTLPPFWDRSVPIVREYQDAMTQAGYNDFSYLSLEGYMAARVAVEALRRVGSRPVTRDAVFASLNAMSSYDLGGIPISFNPDHHEGSRYLDLTLLKSNGTYVR